jgi:arylformamidase
MTSGWRDLDLAAREREYTPSSCIGGNYQPFVQAYADRSHAARQQLPVQRNLQYGNEVTQRLDLFVPPTAPGRAATPPALLVFIHGGYWQELCKDDSSFPATDCVTQGIAYAAIDYTLAPRASVAQIVAECRGALHWLHANAPALGFDARRIVVAGSSAGAHLAAMTALPGKGAAPVRGAVLVSGIFELEPLIGTSINGALGLTPPSARELSPALHDVTGFPPSIVCWGEVETSEFKRQSRDFAARLDAADTACQVFEVPQRNHFDIILDLADPQTLLGRAVTELIRSLY